MERLSSYFHPIETGDARVFLAGAIELFSRYPQEVIDQALDVSIGLPGKHKFWPRISEIKETLDDLHWPIKFKNEWDRRAREQIALRLEMANRPQLPPPQPAPLAHNRLGLSQQDWDAIPDQPQGLKQIMESRSTDPPNQSSAA